MLVTIPRYAPVGNADVGPRFAEYATYTRAGASLQVVALGTAFEIPPRYIGSRAIVQTKAYVPFGYVRAAASLEPAPAPTYARKANSGIQVMASATIIGVASTQDFGYCE